MKNFFSFFIGVITGSVIGSIVALLFAPMRGDVLRGKIKSYAIEVSEEIQEVALAKKGELESKLAKLQNR